MRGAVFTRHGAHSHQQGRSRQRVWINLLQSWVSGALVSRGAQPVGLFSYNSNPPTMSYGMQAHHILQVVCIHYREELGSLPLHNGDPQGICKAGKQCL